MYCAQSQSGQVLPSGGTHTSDSRDWGLRAATGVVRAQTWTMPDGLRLVMNKSTFLCVQQCVHESGIISHTYEP